MNIELCCAFYAILVFIYYFWNVIGNLNLLWGRKSGGGATVHEDYGGVSRGCAHGRRSEKDGGRDDERHENRRVAVHGNWRGEPLGQGASKRQVTGLRGFVRIKRGVKAVGQESAHQNPYAAHVHLYFLSIIFRKNGK